MSGREGRATPEATSHIRGSFEPQRAVADQTGHVNRAPSSHLSRRHLANEQHASRGMTMGACVCMFGGLPT